MAKEKASEEVETSAIKPPAGFRRRAAVSEAPWYKNKERNVAYGKILGRYAMQQEPVRYYIQIELYKESIVTVGRGDDAEEAVAKTGDVINIGETYKMECLRDVEIPEILAGAEYDLWVFTEKKIKLKSGGKTMWIMDVQTKQRKAPTSEVRPLAMTAKESAEGEGGEAPF
jgi:hypothetical protein